MCGFLLGHPVIVSLMFFFLQHHCLNPVQSCKQCVAVQRSFVSFVMSPQRLVNSRCFADVHCPVTDKTHRNRLRIANCQFLGVGMEANN